MEGPIPVQQLLSSSFSCRSVLIDEKYVDNLPVKIAPAQIDKAIPTYVIKHELVEHLVGFKFHRGILACGERKQSASFEDLISCEDLVSCRGTNATSDLMVALCGIQDPENLGSILRSCAAFGAKRILLCSGTADPFGRRALRVSMGTTLELEFYRCDAPVEDLERLKSSGYRLFGTSLEENASELGGIQDDSCKNLLIFGNERRGIPPDVLAVVDDQIRIGMQLDTDSLNVGVAAGIFLHHFSRMTGYRDSHPKL